MTHVSAVRRMCKARERLALVNEPRFPLQESGSYIAVSRLCGLHVQPYKPYTLTWSSCSKLRSNKSSLVRVTKTAPLAGTTVL